MRPGHALLLWGECTYEPNRLRSPRSEALVAGAHPHGRPSRRAGARGAAAIVVLAALVDPMTALLLVGMFGIAFLLQRSG
jgi:hypothetical protein